MNDLPIIQLKDVVPKCTYHFPQPINLQFNQGEQWIIYGPNGGGKTFLVNTLRSANNIRGGKIHYAFPNERSQAVSDNICYVTFHDQYSQSIDTGASAYQMRWNRGAMDETFEPRVADSLKKAPSMPQDEYNRLLEELEITDMLPRTIVSLSSGEFRRFQLARVLIKRPTLLIVDNPFIGLDNEGRKIVSRLLQRLTLNGRLSLILVVSRWPRDTKGFTHVVEVDEGRIEKRLIAPAPIIMEARNINISYGQRTILKDFSITIREGEHWALKGQNGSGKSTLLSLICADNPQGYACDITLFGRQRGSGESIWDIKKNIGFVSPEMYRAYRRNLPVKTIVASGLHDTTGLFRQPKQEDFLCIEKWMQRFKINDWAERSYLSLSSGEQRLVLLCRAFVKNPPLLILDEPFHGLDERNRLMALNIITEYCSLPRKTLIMVSHYDEDFPPIIDHSITLEKQ